MTVQLSAPYTDPQRHDTLPHRQTGGETDGRQSAFWPFKVIQCHARSMILVPIESAYATSYILVINSNFGPI